MMSRLLSKVEPDKPRTETVERLTQIWRQVLRRSDINPHDRFNDLGGNEPLADSVFAEITQVFHRQLPTAAICHAPTIMELAALLELPALPKFSPFVHLKEGNKNPPIIITHGLGGRASFYQLAQHIRLDHPIYGIQGKGVDGLEEPLERIENMATYYLDALSGLQPQGPYILIGYSFGGLIALEMAQRLVENGQRIALLTLVDTYPHPRYFPLSQRLWLGAKRTKNRIGDLKRRPFGAAFSQVRRAIERRLHILKVQKPGALPAASSRLSFAETALRVKQSDLVAMAHYRPRFYEGKIRFVRPEANSYLPNDPTAIWKKLAAEFEVETVPGDHLGMVSLHFQSLAALLTRYISEALIE
jgi:thioesterase domain-containing protein